MVQQVLENQKANEEDGGNPEMSAAGSGAWGNREVRSLNLLQLLQVQKIQQN